MTQNTDRQSENKSSAAGTHKKLTFRQKVGGIVTGSIVFAVIMAALLPGSDSRIVLPSENAATEYHDIVTEQTEYRLADTDITVDNVQQVIESLERPSAYTAPITNTLYWSGAWKEIELVQYVRDGICLTQYNDSDGNAERFEAIKEEVYYAWRRGSDTQYSGAVGAVSADDISMIPTYETVIREDKENITEAGLRTVAGVSCIYVTVADTETGYNLTYWISTVNGLLIQADYTKDGELVRSVVVDEIELEIPAASLFVLPNGTSLLPDETAEKDGLQ